MRSGGGPGFAVGALTALVSNFWLGQGPWTPWQMAGWGMVRCPRRRPGQAARGRAHRPLAACARRARSPALAYGALLDFSRWSLRRRAVARPLPGDLGAWDSVQHRPRRRELRRSRSDRRPGADPDAQPLPRALRVRLGPRSAPVRAGARGAAAAGCVAALVLATRRSRRPRKRPARPRARSDAVDWLRARPRTPTAASASRPGERVEPRDDGLGGPRPGSRPGSTRSPFAPASKTPDRPTCAPPPGRSRPPATSSGRSSSSTRRGWTPATLRRPRTWSQAPAARRGGDGSWGQPGEPDRVRGARARAAAGARPPTDARRPGCAGGQNSDGGWGFAPGAASDADSTGAVAPGAARLRAGTGRRSTGVWPTCAAAQQLDGGGFALAGGGPANSQSTAWAVQGLVAAGTAPSNAPTRRRARLWTTSPRSRPLTATTATRSAYRPDAGMGDRPGPAGGEPAGVPAAGGEPARQEECRR